ncbi:Fructosamine/Ketosamine-3-kinase [Lipomyces arxii]|uniref:Fructosamine/Ketosamine-3-kinase n=1 Tax=Lipomyces arxii TaxID=56418 RepID=UPI0034D01049
MAQMALDAAILNSLPGDSSQYSLPSSIYSAQSFGTTTHINKSGLPTYFLKHARNKDLVAGEFNALKLISRAVPGFCPEPISWGQFASDQDRYFIVESFLPNLQAGSGKVWERNLAQKLAQLHTTATSDTYGLSDGQITCCGSTRLPNPPTRTWSEFFKEHRFKFILAENVRVNGPDTELAHLGAIMLDKVIPALLDNVTSTPSLIHGDLWRGNVGSVIHPPSSDPEPVIYDSCAYYADSEFELGIARMFGGFSSAGFYQPYHHLVPEKEPKAQYDDRIKLYRCFHELNHSALFGGGGYDDQAKSSMKALINKYS